MKKRMQKLTLNRETLRSLEDLHLQGANGGSITGGDSCWNSCPWTFPRSQCLSCRNCTIDFCA